MAEENDTIANKLAEENQVTTKEPQRVTTKNPKKVEAGKRLAESNHKKREVKKREEQAKLEKSGTGKNRFLPKFVKNTGFIWKMFGTIVENRFSRKSIRNQTFSRVWKN